jgi:hypothetical protein
MREAGRGKRYEPSAARVPSLPSRPWPNVGSADGYGTIPRPTNDYRIQWPSRPQRMSVRKGTGLSLPALSYE